MTFIVDFMITNFFCSIMMLVIWMNNFEIIRLLNKMIANTERVKINVKLTYALNRLAIDKNKH